jgi:hypothetical protein
MYDMNQSYLSQITQCKGMSRGNKANIDCKNGLVWLEKNKNEFWRFGVLAFFVCFVFSIII